MLPGGPDLHDGGAQLQVCLVHLRTLPDVDLQVVSDKGEERGGEGDPALLVYWHVHPAAKRVEDVFGKVGFCFSNIAPDQSFVGHLVGAFLSKAKRGVNVFEQLHGLCVVNGAPGERAQDVRIFFGRTVGIGGVLSGMKAIRNIHRKVSKVGGRAKMESFANVTKSA